MTWTMGGMQTAALRGLHATSPNAARRSKAASAAENEENRAYTTRGNGACAAVGVPEDVARPCPDPAPVIVAAVGAIRAPEAILPSMELAYRRGAPCSADCGGRAGAVSEATLAAELSGMEASTPTKPGKARTSSWTSHMLADAGKESKTSEHKSGSNAKRGGACPVRPSVMPMALSTFGCEDDKAEGAVRDRPSNKPARSPSANSTADLLTVITSKSNLRSLATGWYLSRSIPWSLCAAKSAPAFPRKKASRYDS
mmetsp:Transcript_92659/g.261671  ORF Transcript_92659/g.261671 Transcript_92659/m.261671 type:complete len:256 (+) Transcript_92659:552-1319(+)